MHNLPHMRNPSDNCRPSCISNLWPAEVCEMMPQEALVHVVLLRVQQFVHSMSSHFANVICEKACLRYAPALYEDRYA